jgi:hypothetical protein
MKLFKRQKSLNSQIWTGSYPRGVAGVNDAKVSHLSRDIVAMPTG